MGRHSCDRLGVCQMHSPRCTGCDHDERNDTPPDQWAWIDGVVMRWLVVAIVVSSVCSAYLMVAAVTR